MAYFPFFIDLNEKKGLVVGGGRVATRKIRALLPYGPQLTVCAPSLLPELETIPELILLRQPFSPAMLDGAFFVLAATNDPQLNRHITQLCKERRIPVNVAAPGDESTFLFPSLVRRGPLSIGISSGGASPSASHYLREQIDALLPNGLEDILVWMDAWRAELKKSPLPQPRRSALLAQLFSAAIQAGRSLSRAEVQALLPDFERETEELP